MKNKMIFYNKWPSIRRLDALLAKSLTLMGILYFVKQIKAICGMMFLELLSMLCIMNQLEQGWTLNFYNSYHFSP